MQKEIGRIGQRRFGGIVYEEFLPELRGSRGVEIYREMSENDDVVGAILYAVEMLVRQTKWNVEPGGSTAKDKEAAEFVESCMDDMQNTWVDTISEILSFLAYGWSYHEIVYKRRMGNTADTRTRSKYSDGLIGWAKLPIRAQETLYQWEYDENDNLTGMTQMPPPDYGLLTIPLSKALLFRTKSRKDNPEGRSILRNAYRSWHFKRRIQEIEGIGIERDLAGLPVMHVPEGMDIWNDNDDMKRTLVRLEEMVRGIRRDEMEGLVLPYGFELELLSSGGTRQFDTNAIIDRYDTRIAMTVLADFIFLGHQQNGSWALSSDKTELFAMACGAYLDIIAETFNSQGITDMKVVHVPEDGKNFIPYELTGKTIDFDDGELSFNVSKKERDYEVTLDICRDYTGSLVMGADTGDRYVAQLIIPERAYTETEIANPNYNADAEGGTENPTITQRIPVPFDINRCELRLWELED